MTDQRILCWLSETKEDSCETLLIFLLSVKELTFMCNELLIPITSQRLRILKGQATVTFCIHVRESMPFKPKSSIGNENNKSIFQYHDLLGWWFNLKIKIQITQVWNHLTLNLLSFYWGAKASHWLEKICEATKMA